MSFSALSTTPVPAISSELSAGFVPLSSGLDEAPPLSPIDPAGRALRIAKLTEQKLAYTALPQAGADWKVVPPLPPTPILAPASSANSLLSTLQLNASVDEQSPARNLHILNQCIQNPQVLSEAQRTGALWRDFVWCIGKERYSVEDLALFCSTLITAIYQKGLALKYDKQGFRALHVALQISQIKSPSINFCSMRPLFFEMALAAGQTKLEKRLWKIWEEMPADNMLDPEEAQQEMPALPELR